MARPSFSQAADQVTVSAVGDIRLNGAVGRLIRLHGPDYPVARIKKLLKADIVFGNLECSITSRGEKVSKKWNFRAPPRTLESLKAAGFTILNLANNHSMDYGATGFLDTIRAVKKYRFAYLGGGRDLAEAEKLRVFEVKGVKVGFLGFTSTFPKTAWAKKDRPGVDYSDFARFPALIRRAKKRCDVLVVSLHGGTELDPDPNELQEAFAHDAIRAGADIVIGHHPHVLQAAEIYDGKPILYSLGNFLFVSPAPSTRYTAVARIVLGKSGVIHIGFIPVDTDGGRPHRAGTEGAAAVYQDLNREGALAQYPDFFQVEGSTIARKSG